MDREYRRIRLGLGLEALEDRNLLSSGLVSMDNSGNATGDYFSDKPSVSADGPYVAFESAADNLVTGISDIPNTLDVFVYDHSMGITRMVSTNSSGTAAGNAPSFNPVISGNGQFVVFQSYASDLVSGTLDGNGLPDIYERNLLTGITTLVSVNKTGTAAGSGTSDQAVVSPDGRFIAFRSTDPDLVAGDNNSVADIFIRDTKLGITTLASVTPSGTSGNDQSLTPVISADGRYVAFESLASNLVAGDANGLPDVFVRDVVSGRTILASVNSSGTGSGNSDAESPSISADGRFVSFSSSSTNLVPGLTDNNGTSDIFVRDLTRNTTTLVSVNSSGAAGNRFSDLPIISSNGNVVVFRSAASDLVSGVTYTTNAYNLFARDLVHGTTALVSADPSGKTAGNASSDTPAVSGDGRFVAFQSLATNLVSGITDSNNNEDVFVRDMLINQTGLASINYTGKATGNGASTTPFISGAGSLVVFQSAASNMEISPDSNNATDVFSQPLAGIAAHFQLTSAATTVAGSSLSLTAKAVDFFGNLVTGYLGTIHFSSSDSIATLPANYTFTSSDQGVHTFVSGVNLRHAGAQTVTATDTVTVSVNGITTVTVNAAAANHISVSVPSSVLAGTPSSMTVTAQDPYGNTAVTYFGTIHFTSSDSTAVLPADFTFTTTESGSHTFSNVTLRKAGNATVTGTDTIDHAIAGQASVTVNAAAATHFAINLPFAVNPGTPFTFTVIAQDPFNNQSGLYPGTVHFTSSDGSATLPGNYTFSSSDKGLHVFSNGALLRTVGAQTITATDTVQSTITGAGTVQVGAGPSRLFGRASVNGQWWLAVSNGSGSFTSSLWATWSNLVTWVDVQTGDFNGDGQPDIAGRVLQTGQWWVSLSAGSSSVTSLWTIWSTAGNWVDVRVGDFNGDGKTDIVGRFAIGGQWWVAQSTGSSFINSLWSTWSTAVSWVDVQVGDFNGDGKADITGRAALYGQWWSGVSTGSQFTTALWAAWSPAVTWTDVQVGDFNGDGKEDIIGRVLQSGAWWAGLSTGSAFTSVYWAQWSPLVTWVDVKVGDLNGDGKDDIIGRVLSGGQWWAGLSTGSTCQTRLWAAWSPAVTWVDVQIGDFNGDGKADITGRVLQGGAWWTGVSSGSSLLTSWWGSWSPAITWLDVQAS